MATETQYYALQKPSYDEVADIEVVNANMDKIDQQMRTNADGVNFAKGISSDAYDNSKSYAVGDYCIYDNKLYKCITAITSAEAFDISKWQQTTCGKELSILIENDAKLNSNLVEQKMLGWTVPTEMPIKNYVDSDGVFHQRVGRVNLGERNWIIFDGRFLSTDFVAKSKTTNLLTKKYKPVSDYGYNVNGTIYANGVELYICDLSYTDSSLFKSAMQGEYLYYELAEEKLIKVDGNEAVEKLKNDLNKFDSIDGIEISNDGNLVITANGSRFTFTPSGVVV